MQAILIERAGGPEVLKWAVTDDPVPGPDEILVRVRSTALNRADVLQRRGLYPAPPGARSDIPGLEFAGLVERAAEVGESPAVGDRVMGILAGAGHAEKIVTHPCLALPIPEKLSWTQAAAVPEVFLTAFDALRQLNLSPGQRLLIHAVASGVGTAALQLAKHAGLEVFGTAGSPEKLKLASRLGLDHPIHYPSQDFAEAVSTATRGGGVDAIIDFVGASYWRRNLNSLALRGRLILVGTLGGVQAETDLGTLLRKRLTVIGTVLRSRSLAEKAELTQDFRKHALPLLANGQIQPVIDRVLSLPQAAEAHKVMESNQNAGKIVLEVA